MTDPAIFTAAIDNASKVANTSLFTNIIDKLTGFKISEWAAEGEVRKKLIHDEYQKAKENGISGMQYITYLRQTTNLIETATKSAKYIDQDKVNEVEMDNDFFWNTIEHAKTVSNEEIQELIAKIIAGEYNTPGSYSMSTLQTLKMLGKKELDILEKSCSLCLHGDQIPKAAFMNFGPLHPSEAFAGINYEEFQMLQSLGLFLPNEMIKSTPNPRRLLYKCEYFDKFITFKPVSDAHFHLEFPPFYRLSTTGKEITKHLNPSFSQGYFDWLREHYKIKNFISEIVD